MKKKLKLSLNGLDCANCANKIESIVDKFDEISDVTLNFSFKLLIVTYDNDIIKEEDLINKITKVVNDLEPDVKVEKYTLSSKKNSTSNNTISHCKDGSCEHEHHGKDECHGEHCNHSHSHSHSHDHNSVANLQKDNSRNKTSKFIDILKENFRLFSGIILFVCAMLLDHNVILFLISYLLVGVDVLLSAFRNISKGKIFDENFLMSIATIGAFLVGQYPEGVAVMIFYEIGEMFQSYAVNKSRASISELMDIKAEYANLVNNEEVIKVSPEEVKIDDVILIKPGERIPLDGKILEGNTTIDSSALTGESIPVNKEIGDEILAGCINITGTIKVKVTSEFEESTVARILELVQNASSKKAETEKFITKFSKYYTPIVVFSALALAVIPPLVIPNASSSEWIYRALIFLVVSCPCALVVSVPLGLFAGIGGASKKGILIKGGNYLEGLKDVETVVFDKTGTLTKGVFKVTKINSENNSKSKILRYAAIGEQYSNHPIAKSILDEFKISSKENISKVKIEEHEEIAGKGVKARFEGDDVLIGNSKLMDINNISIPKNDDVGTIVHVAINGIYEGSIVISDKIKDDSKEAISRLKALGVKRVVMLTGDSKKVAEDVSKKIGITDVYSELLPQNKVEKVEELLKEENRGKVAFVGDGINDAPVLARADIGVAMGGIGSDAAIEAADVVLMKDEPSALADAIEIGRRTNKILWQNIIFSLGIKILVLILATLGDANMWEAVFADVGVTLIAVLNSMRALK